MTSAEFKTLYERVQSRGGFKELVKTPPAAELAQLDWMIGAWSQSVRVFRTSTTDERYQPTMSALRCRWSHNGHWLVMEEGEVIGTYLTYDPIECCWVLVMIGGNAFRNVSTTPDWQEGQLIFETVLRLIDEPFDCRHRLVKLSEHHWKWQNDERLPDGQWFLVDEHEFHRMGESTDGR